MWLFFLLLAIDFVTKRLTLAYLSKVDTFPIIKGVFHLTYVENRGIAFGMLRNMQWLVIIFTLFAIACLFYWYFKKTDKKDRFLRFSIILVMAGAVGNLIDRVFYGFVVDMLDFRLINFYVFNFADACVCVGMAFLAYYVIVLEGKRS